MLLNWDASPECNGCFANATAVKHGYRCCEDCRHNHIGELYNQKLAFCLAATGLDAPPVVVSFTGAAAAPVDEFNLHDVPY